MAANLEERIRALEDREKIQELRATYCFLVDDGHVDELVEHLFTEDARCDFRARSGAFEPMIATGREQLREFFGRLVPSILQGMSHTVHNHRIAIEGDQASGDCYFEVTATDVISGEAVMGAGRYIDRYRRVDGEWCFEERRAEIFHMAPLAPGWAKQPFLAVLGAGSD
jgi:hypothetical protein